MNVNFWKLLYCIACLLVICYKPVFAVIINKADITYAFNDSIIDNIAPLSDEEMVNINGNYNLHEIKVRIYDHHFTERMNINHDEHGTNTDFPNKHISIPIYEAALLIFVESREYLFEKIRDLENNWGTAISSLTYSRIDFPMNGLKSKWEVDSYMDKIEREIKYHRSPYSHGRHTSGIQRVSGMGKEAIRRYDENRARKNAYIDRGTKTTEEYECMLGKISLHRKTADDLKGASQEVIDAAMKLQIEMRLRALEDCKNNRHIRAIGGRNLLSNGTNLLK